MSGVSEQSSATSEPLATDADSQLTRANKYACSLLAGSQNVLLDEVIFAGNEFLERAIAETRIFNEFIHKLAEARSVKDLGRCTRGHQASAEFIRRDTEPLLKHTDRVIDNTSKLVET